MRPAPPSRSSSELDSALGESAYDIISTGDLTSDNGMLSDDDAQTESLASSLSARGDDSEEEDVMNTPLDSLIFPGQRAMIDDGSAINITPTIGDSGYTSHTVRPSSPTMSMTYVTFKDDQESSASTTETHLRHIIQDVKEPNCSMELCIYQARYVGMDMKLAVCKGIAKPKAKYRILILSYHPHYVGEVAAHVQAALDQNLRDSGIIDRVRLEVSYCHEAMTRSSGRREVNLCIDQHPDVTVRGGSAFVQDKPCPLWDLAVFLHTSLAEIPTFEIESYEASFSSARLAMTSSRIPIVDLSTHHPLYTAAPPAFICNSKTLHLHVTTKETDTSEEITRELLPVDLDQFFAIDPRTLGRHLDCLSSPTERLKTTTRSASMGQSMQMYWNATRKTMMSCMMRIQNAVAPYNAQLQPHQTLQNVGWTQTCLLLLASVSIVFVAAQLQSYLVSSGSSAALTVPSVESPAIAANWAELFSKPAASVSSQKPATALKPKEASAREKTIGATTNNHVSVYPSTKDIMRPLNLVHEAVQHEDAFTLELVGAHTLLLTPRSDLAPKKVIITIFQDGEELDTLVKPVSDGTWVIGVHKRQAQGQAIVLVRGFHSQAGKRPYIHKFPIDFGHPKTSFESIKDKLVGEVIVAQKNARAISTRMTTGIQKYIDQLESSTQKFHNQAVKRVDNTRKALTRLSISDDDMTKVSDKKNRDLQFDEAREALQKETKALIRTVQSVAIQQYHDAAWLIQSVQLWREQTSWPVRASDWAPRIAIKRGAGNAKDLIKLLGGGRVEKINACLKKPQGCSRRKRSSKKTPCVGR